MVRLDFEQFSSAPKVDKLTDLANKPRFRYIGISGGQIVESWGAAE